jgi:hypothetical protein
MNWTAFAGILSQMLPVVFKAVEIVAKDKGKPIDQVVKDVIDHLTPGAPNSPALNG